MSTTIIPQLTNHIVMTIDKSGSMGGLEHTVKAVFKAQINQLRKRSVELNQDTRISIYLFNTSAQCVVFDMDVMRNIDLDALYHASGGTALMDAAGLAITDHQKIPEMYGDHAFLFYAITDGEENESRKYSAPSLRNLIDRLPDNWTVAALVPNASGRHEAKKFGFPEGNIEIWSTTSTGLESIGRTMTSATDAFMNNRSMGIRSTKSLFQTDMSQVTVKDVKSKLSELATNRYNIYDVKQISEIRTFVEHATKRDYVKGTAYYRLDKPETIQASKVIAVQNRKTHKVYSGIDAREVLGLPTHDIRVAPGAHGEWDIFVQSTSVNRKLYPGTQVLVVA